MYILPVDMSFEFILSTESFSTLFALEWFFPSVSSPMSGQMRSSTELGWAKVAMIRFIVQMPLQMAAQIWQIGCVFGANGANGKGHLKRFKERNSDRFISIVMMLVLYSCKCNPKLQDFSLVLPNVTLITAIAAVNICSMINLLVS